ncbi:MAG: low molecular weight protein-tyrosine-phosphatase [Gammaproteobacteria bacterium]
MKVLFVDAGNYCRSPAAEIVARTIASRSDVSGWQFSSAGLKDKHVGDTADPRSIEACAARGYDLSAFRCREISEDDYRSHDVILAMDRDNASQLEARRPDGNSTPIRLFLGDREVPDPYYGESDGFSLMMSQIEEGVRALLGQGQA